MHQCLLEESRIIPVGAVTNNSRGLQWEDFVHHTTAPSEGNKHVRLPTSYLCQRQCLQRKTGHSLWPPCNVQWLLGATCDNIISPCGTWLSAELSAGDLSHWQIRVPSISLSSTTVQNYSQRPPSKMTMLMPKLISHLKAEITVNNIPLWLYVESIWLCVSFSFFFFSFSTWIFFCIFLLKIQI